MLFALMWWFQPLGITKYPTWSLSFPRLRPERAWDDGSTMCCVASITKTLSQLQFLGIEQSTTTPTPTTAATTTICNHQFIGLIFTVQLLMVT